jgi:hypothetical protein
MPHVDLPPPSCRQAARGTALRRRPALTARLLDDGLRGGGSQSGSAGLLALDEVDTDELESA